MCIEFQHLSCQVVVIKGLAYLLTYFISVVIDSKLKDWINFGIYWRLRAAITPPYNVAHVLSAY